MSEHLKIVKKTQKYFLNIFAVPFWQKKKTVVFGTGIFFFYFFFAPRPLKRIDLCLHKKKKQKSERACTVVISIAANHGDI